MTDRTPTPPRTDRLLNDVRSSRSGLSTGQAAIGTVAVGGLCAAVTALAAPHIPAPDVVAGALRAALPNLPTDGLPGGGLPVAAVAPGLVAAAVSIARKPMEAIAKVLFAGRAAPALAQANTDGFFVRPAGAVGLRRVDEAGFDAFVATVLDKGETLDLVRVDERGTISHHHYRNGLLSDHVEKDRVVAAVRVYHATGEYIHTYCKEGRRVYESRGNKTEQWRRERESLGERIAWSLQTFRRRLWPETETDEPARGR